MNGRRFLGTGLVAVGSTVQADDDAETIYVSGERSTIEDGVDAADEGNLVLADPGSHEETAEVTTHGVPVRGRDRNAVVLDGEFQRDHGVDVEADGVVVERPTWATWCTIATTWTPRPWSRSSRRSERASSCGAGATMSSKETSSTATSTSAPSRTPT